MKMHVYMKAGRVGKGRACAGRCGGDRRQEEKEEAGIQAGRRAGRMRQEGGGRVAGRQKSGRQV